MSIRSKKRNDAGKWVAVPGQVLGSIVIVKGQEASGSNLLRLIEIGVCTGKEANLLDFEVSPRGLFVVAIETQEPMYALEPDEG